MSGEKIIKKRALSTLVLLIAVCVVCAFSAAVSAEESNVTVISTREQLLELSGASLNGNYALDADIDLSGSTFKGISRLVGTFDGRGHTVTLDMNVSGTAAFIIKLGNAVAGSGATVYEYGYVKNLTVAGSVRGGGRTAAIAATALGEIDGCTVTADVSSNSVSSVSAFANTDGKYPLTIKNCTFYGTITYEYQNNSQNNYSYFGIFLGYNGGAFGGGRVENCRVNYTFSMPVADAERVASAEFFNCGEGSEISCDKNAETAQYSVYLPVSMDEITVNSLNDEGIMSNYGAPVVRLKLTDSSYRYFDGFNKAQSRFETRFGAVVLDEMYAYKDISYLKVDSVTSVNAYGIASEFSYVEVSDAAEFESFARLINSAVPCAFTDKNGDAKQFTILNSLTIAVRLTDDIDLTVGDANGNASTFCGFGKQEFFPYRAGIDGNGKTLTVNINCPDGYDVGIISVASEMERAITIENLTVNGNIVGKTKTGIVAYHDLVCNNYVVGGDLKFINVVNNADVSGRTGVGGFVGVSAVTYLRKGVYFDNCTNSGDISSYSASGMFVGGFVGAAGFFGTNRSSIDLKDCTNNGNVSGTVSGTAQTKYLGGIAGIITGSESVFDNVTSTGAVTGSVTGELVGRSDCIKVVGEKLETSTAIGELKETFARKFTYPTYSFDYGSAVKQSLSGVLSEAYTTEISYSGTLLTGESYSSKTAPTQPGEYTAELSCKQDADNYYTKNGYVQSVVSTSQLTIEKAVLTPVISAETVIPFTAEKGVLNTVALPELPEGAYFSAEYESDFNGEVTTEGVYDMGGYTVRITLNTTENFEKHYAVDDGLRSFTVRLTVTKPTITVTADSFEAFEGDRRKIGYTVEGVVEGFDIDLDALGITLDYSTTKDMAVGAYTVTVSGELETENYTITYVSGRIIVKTAVPSEGCGASIDGAPYICLVAFTLLFAVRKAAKKARRGEHCR